MSCLVLPQLIQHLIITAPLVQLILFRTRNVNVESKRAYNGTQASEIMSSDAVMGKINEQGGKRSA